MSKLLNEQELAEARDLAEDRAAWPVAPDLVVAIAMGRLLCLLDHIEALDEVCERAHEGFQAQVLRVRELDKTLAKQEEWYTSAIEKASRVLCQAHQAEGPTICGDYCWICATEAALYPIAVKGGDSS